MVGLTFCRLGPASATSNLVPDGSYAAGYDSQSWTEGQVVIPKELRDELPIAPGDEVTFWREGDHVAVRSVRAGRPIKGRFAAPTAIAHGAMLLTGDPELRQNGVPWRWEDPRTLRVN